MSIQFLNRQLQLPSCVAQVQERENFDHWMMTDAERSSLSNLLQQSRPECAIEIGTYKAGSLSLLSQYADEVYSIDIDESCKTEFGPSFNNVTFVTGPSDQRIPEVLEEIKSAGKKLGFILIDGDHSEQGVRSDINALLSYEPVVPLVIVMHDSFNPDCRRGMYTANWADNPYVHLVELDYVSGRLIAADEGKEQEGQMWCGFGLALMFPEKRTESLVIRENEKPGYRAAYWHSVYPYRNVKSFVTQTPRRAARYVKRRLLPAK